MERLGRRRNRAEQKSTDDEDKKALYLQILKTLISSKFPQTLKALYIYVSQLKCLCTSFVYVFVRSRYWMQVYLHYTTDTYTRYAHIYINITHTYVHSKSVEIQ